MRRKQKAVDRDGYPPPLDVFNSADWWVKDPNCSMQLGYGRICWWVARRAYVDGEDWQRHLNPPVWWDSTPAPGGSESPT